MKWFVVRNGKEQGPFSAAQLRQFAASGQLLRTDQVRREDMTRPVVAESVKGLFDVAAQPQQPAQAPPLPAARATSEATQTAGPIGFRDWYRKRIGRLPVILQIVCWFAYGFFWIPMWWGFAARRYSLALIMLFLLLSSAYNAAVHRKAVYANQERQRQSQELILSVTLNSEEADADLAGITEITSPQVWEDLNSKLSLLDQGSTGFTEKRDELVLTAMKQEVRYREQEAKAEAERLAKEEAQRKADEEAAKQAEIERLKKLPANKLTIDQFRERTWGGVFSPRDKFYNRFGKPLSITTIGNDTYLMYECADGIAQLVCPTGSFQFQDSINPYQINQMR